MTYPSMAIIGTAGRGEDKDLLTRFHYDRMVEGATKLINHLKIDPHELKLISGGAAWADHIVVTLALLGGVKFENVTLFLPTDIHETGFFADTEKASKTAATANYYHRIFSERLGQDTIRQITDIGALGATLKKGHGNFHARNAQVAKSISPDGVLLAYTTGSPDCDQDVWSARRFNPEDTAGYAGLKDGGTAHTWNISECEKWHIRIGETNDYNNLI